MTDYAGSLAEIALEINAIKLSPQKPFTWASGYQMPIYNDNRLFLGNYQHRALIASGFMAVIQQHKLNVQVVAGTVTAGISPGTTLADRLKTPFIYVREKPKEHGLRNRIEGILQQGEQVLMVEDLVSTGGSSLSAIEAVREAGGKLENCLCIFSYGLEEAVHKFNRINCSLIPLLTFEVLLETAIKRKYISDTELKLLQEWRISPFEWGDKNGFPKIEKNKS